ncbi:MAG: ankyrin repeat domain-containing protein [Gemmatimonadota bacterium]|nr:ankyrin repeat domain-containing protein [Gemmatimonadota bacterium]
MATRVNAWLPLLLFAALAPWMPDGGRPGAAAGYLVPPPVLDPSTESPVADAAMRGDRDAVRGLLAEGADVNAAQGDGMTALHWSARNGDPSLANVLLDAGADVHAGTRIGHYTALHMAGEVGAGEVVALLLDAGADPMARVDVAGRPTPLHFAAASGSVLAVEALLGAGADASATEESWGQTPLIFAASKGRTEAVRSLLAAGADASMHTGVMDVVARAVTDRIERSERNRRVAAGEPWGPEVAETLRREQEEESRRERAEAASLEESETRMIEEPEPLSYGELVGGHGGLTALLHAAREGHAETAFALVNGGADIDQTSAGDGTSPMLMAAINGHYDLAMRLLERGADPNLASHAGATPLFAALNTHWAPKSRYPQQHIYMQQDHTYLEVMRKLLEAGADPNVRLRKHLWFMSYNFDLLQIDAKGATPFWRAAYALDVEAMKLLVAYGADPSIPTEKVPSRRYGRGGDDTADASGLPPVPVGGPAVYPVHAAAGVGYGQGFAGNAHRHVPDAWIPAVRYLVEELGADVNARDHEGFSPLHHAAARGDNELILYLVEQGADVTLVSRRGQTTVDMANGPVQRIQPFPETIALLESLGAVNNHNCVSC